MSNNYAHVVDGTVINLIIADENWVQNQTNPEQFVIYTNAVPAYMGGQYNNGFFYEPQPFPSWTMDDNSSTWLPPVPKPDGALGMYSYWNEELMQWLPRQEALVWNEYTEEWLIAPGFGFNPDYAG